MKTNLPFAVWLGGRDKNLLSLLVSPLPLYAPILCRFGFLSTSTLLLPQFGMKSRSPRARTIIMKTPAIDIQTILFLIKDFFDFSGVDSSCADGSSACFPGTFEGDSFAGGVLPGDVLPGGGLPEGTPPKNGGAGLGVGGGDDGAGTGATVALNGFPSFLHQKTFISNRSKERSRQAYSYA